MGRTRTKKQSKATISTTTQSAYSQGPSISSLLEKAQSLIVQCDYELALKFSERVLEKDRRNVEAKEILGVALLETGDIAAAKDVRKILVSYVKKLTNNRRLSNL
jgi:Flp pilus assembly protein TadD